MRLDLASRLGVTLEQQDSPCPACTKPSRAIRLEQRREKVELLSPKERKQLEQINAWRPQLCAECAQTRDVENRGVEPKRVFRLEVPALYRDVSFDTYQLHGDAKQRTQLEHALAFAKGYASTFPDVPMITVFAGAPGTGKGHLAWSIAKQVVADPECSARVDVLSDVIRDLRESWSRRDDDGPSEGQRLAKYRDVDLLVIDEVSRHAFFGQPQQHLYDLVAWREIRLKPTILTTNELGDALGHVLGDALSSRVLGWDGLIRFGDADFRATQRLMRRVS